MNVFFGNSDFMCGVGGLDLMVLSVNLGMDSFRLGIFGCWAYF